MKKYTKNIINNKKTEENINIEETKEIQVTKK